MTRRELIALLAAAPLALPALGQDFDFPLLVGARDTARMTLAGIQPALRVECVASGAIGIIAEDTGLLARRELEEFVAGNVAKNQVAFPGPSRAFGEDIPSGYLFEPQVTEVLSRGTNAEQGH